MNGNKKRRFGLDGTIERLKLFVHLIPTQAPAGVLCATGTSGFGCAGPGVANLSGLGNQSFTTLGLTYILNDGLPLSFDITEIITGNLGGGATTPAWIKITNLFAANLGGAAINDNIYIFSDVFNGSVAGTAGVGVVGIYGATPAAGVVPVFGLYSASSQAQMNYLFAPAGLGGPGVVPVLSLTTPSTFAIGSPGPAVAFYEWARSPIIGGVVRLVGGLNFQLTPGSAIYMPGSIIVNANDPSEYLSETPEPGTIGPLSAGMLGLGLFTRRRVRA